MNSLDAFWATFVALLCLCVIAAWMDGRPDTRWRGCSACGGARRSAGGYRCEVCAGTGRLKVKQ